MEILIDILEAGMLFCFGFAWPFNIYKSHKARSNKGKSLLFLLVIWAGYFLGIINKALKYRDFRHDFPLWLYVLNILLVSADVALYYRNYKIDRLKVTDL